MRTMKLRLHKNSIFMALLILTYAIRAITDAVFVSREVSNGWTSVKYLTVFLAIVYGTACLLQSGRKWHCLYVIKYIGLAAGTLLAISILRMIYAGVFSIIPIKIVFNMLLPVAVAVLTMSLLDSEDVYNCLSWILVITFCIYCVFEIGLENFSAAKFASISFSSSYSPFESHYTSGTAMALCAYFAYYRKRKVMTVISLFFSLLVFKRLFVLFSIVIFLLPMFFNVKRRVSAWIPYCAAACFCVLTFFYYWCMIPENQDVILQLLNIDSLRNFTSGRSAFFSELYSSSFFVNFGLGSTEAYLGRPMEMDLIQILVETSFVGLIVFTFAYWKLSGTTWFGVLYMAFNFLNMLTSHSFQNGFIWSIVLITFLQIEKETQLQPQTHARRVKLYIGS